MIDIVTRENERSEWSPHNGNDMNVNSSQWSPGNVNDYLACIDMNANAN
jgi:hypothetical protein